MGADMGDAGRPRTETADEAVRRSGLQQWAGENRAIAKSGLTIEQFADE